MRPTDRERRIGPMAWAIAAAVVFAVLGWNLGGHGLWDPWETHYAEVARQILVRGDPINLWWQPGEGPDGLSERRFWSKPALSFWLMALSLRAFELGTSADPHELVRGPGLEIAVRLPAVVLACATCWILGRTVRRFAGDRAGLLALAVCGTLPQFAMVGRQALTDMPMVATATWALCAIAIAELDPTSERDLPRRRLGPVSVPWSSWTLWCGLVVAIGALAPVATITYLSREWVQMVPYQVALVVLALAIGRARCDRELLWIVAHASLGLSFLAKGFVGPAVVAISVLVFAVADGRVLIITRHALFGPAPLAFACTGLPWHHAMVVRKGARFVAALVIEHQVRRFGSGEQPQAVGSATFYLRALALGAFPWVSLAPAALARLWPTASRPRPPGAAFDVLVLSWLLASLGVVSLSAAKYNHYLVPAMPAVAVAVALVLARPNLRSARPLALGGLALGALVSWELVREPASLAQLVTYVSTDPWRELPVDSLLVPLCAAPCAVALAMLAFGRAPRWALAPMLVAGLAVTAATVHVYVPRAGRVWSQRPLHEQLARAASPDTPLIAWRLNHRGETLYSKARVWVSVSGDTEALRAKLGVDSTPRPHHVLTTPRHVDELTSLAPGWTVDPIVSTPQRVLLRLTP